VTRARIIAVLAVAACHAHVDGPADDHAARDRGAGVELALHLRTLPGVIAASAIVHTPWQDPLAPTPAPTVAGADHASASIAITAASGVDAARLERDARRLAAAALATDPGALTIAVEPVEAPATTSKVGPFEVAPSSRGALTLTLLLALAVIAGLAVWVAALQLKKRR